MRVIIFFDLPQVTLEEKKIYRDYRKYLIRSGFSMVQESVYSKICLNQTAADLTMAAMKKFVPSKGIIQALTITEKQYNKIQYLSGTKKSNVVDSDSRLIRLWN